MVRLQVSRLVQLAALKIPAALVAVASLVGFWLIVHRGTPYSVPARAYAEVVDHYVGPLTNGRIATVAVRVGQAVKAGDVLATMDRRDAEARREIAKAELAEARAMVLAEKEQQEVEVLRSEILVLRSHADARQDQAELDELNRQLTRLDSLAAKQLVPQTELEEQRRLREGLAARTAAFQEARVRSRSGLGRAASRTQSRTAQLKARLAPFEEAVAIKAAELRQIEGEIEDGVVRTRVDGMVAAILKQPGEVITAGLGVVRVVSARPGVVIAWLAERQCHNVALGQSVTLRRGRLLSASLHGEVTEIGPEIEVLPERIWITPNTPAWGRRVVITAPSAGDLLPGETLRVRL